MMIRLSGLLILFGSVPRREMKQSRPFEGVNPFTGKGKTPHMVLRRLK